MPTTRIVVALRERRRRILLDAERDALRAEWATLSNQINTGKVSTRPNRDLRPWSARNLPETTRSTTVRN